MAVDVPRTTESVATTLQANLQRRRAGGCVEDAAGCVSVDGPLAVAEIVGCRAGLGKKPPVNLKLNNGGRPPVNSDGPIGMCLIVFGIVGSAVLIGGARCG